LRRRGLILVALAAAALLAINAVPAAARRLYGPPAKWLTLPEVVEYSVKLLWADGLLTRPLLQRAPERSFEVLPGESVDSVCQRLEADGLIADAHAFRDYLVYSGQDTTLQAGAYQISASTSMLAIARRMQDATPTEVDFVVLAGWRIEEIAAALPTSGMDIDPAQFVQAAKSPWPGFDVLAGASTTEGFLFPDSYVLPRSANSQELLDALIRNFRQRLTADLGEGYSRQGLDVYGAVTLASIIEREAVRTQEAPLIASVYLNRLRSGMRLDADPTVQYALGFNPVQETWWTNPLSLDDLKVQSIYNTYLNTGLPPAPISNPGPDALRAVAEPADSPYYFFNAKCDGSGYHTFAQDFAEHLGNLCP